MKKIYFKLFLLTSLFVLASCKNSGSKENENSNGENDNQIEEIDNQEEVDEFKALLSKQDLSPFYEKQFSAMFKQDYASYTNYYGDEEEKSIDFYRYSGSGAYGYFYSVTQDEYEEIIIKENVNPFDFITIGQGNYSLIQFADVNSFSSEMVDDLEETSTRDFKYYQRLDSQFDDTNYQLYNTFTMNENNSGTPTIDTKFNGIVNKDSLLEVVSTSWLTDTIQRVCAFDGHKNTEFLDGLYYDVCRGLLNKSDEEISVFLKNNNIVISDGEEYTELSFELNDEEILEIMIDNDIFPGSFNGTLYYDKETGSFEKYFYEIKYINTKTDEEEACISSTTLIFTATGYSYHETYDEVPYIDPNVEEYTDAYEFVSDMLENIIPPISVS